MEYWDNWQVWYKPRIYAANDTELIVSNGRITTHDGTTVRVHKYGAVSIA
jgi:hypothetical protein